MSLVQISVLFVWHQERPKMKASEMENTANSSLLYFLTHVVLPRKNWAEMHAFRWSEMFFRLASAHKNINTLFWHNYWIFFFFSKTKHVFCCCFRRGVFVWKVVLVVMSATRISGHNTLNFRAASNVITFSLHLWGMNRLLVIKSVWKSTASLNQWAGHWSKTLYHWKC